MSFVSGTSRLTTPGIPDAGYVDWRGRPFLQIESFDNLPPFLINLVGAYDFWAYISSLGSLTAGRVDADNSVFPYQTEDKLHDASGRIGPTTLIRIGRSSDPTGVWEPFSRPGVPADNVDRSLLKNLIGNQLVFDEHHRELGLRFSYRWTTTEEFGLVRTAFLTNTGSGPQTLDFIDGVQHVMPWGLTRGTYDALSCLTRAYSRAETDSQSGLAVFSLTSGIVDDAHPCEILRANVGWSVGLSQPSIHFSSKAINDFRLDRALQSDQMVAGVRTSFLQSATNITLAPGETRSWHLALDCGLDHAAIIALRHRLLDHESLAGDLEQAIERSERDLVRFVAAADGLQETADRNSSVHHFANVLFNGLRGGCFTDNYDISRADFVAFVRQRNQVVAERHTGWMSTLSDPCRLDDLLQTIREQNDPDLLRLGYEFLPISHSRRHGDPSRPWNRFSIKLKQPDGSRNLHYEGNWRDIFQNWEALCVSYPAFLESVITKFVNGSTVDGFNPYRVTSEGMEWEEPDPDDPWANIGYWGDHQIVYLLRLLEALQAHDPDRLAQLIAEDHFVYLQVPYRIKPYHELLKNPRESIDFDRPLAGMLAERVRELGEDGKLLRDAEGALQRATLGEKLLVPALSKLSNFVPGGGIWMNTQRPEWNDANNALVGNGASLVTLCYLRRYLNFLADLIEHQPQESLSVPREVEHWMVELRGVLDEHKQMLDHVEISDHERRDFVDAIGQAFTDYRTLLYDHGFTQKVPVATADVSGICRLAAAYADQTIRMAAREDALYDAYNVVKFGPDGSLAVKPLFEMLEGQVAVISSGALSGEEVCDLVDALYLSRMYREDQNSFMLYPERTLGDFIDRNVVPESAASEIALLSRLLEAGDRSLIYRDPMGIHRFASHLRRRSDVLESLERLSQDERWSALVTSDGGAVATLFERVFQHHTFTGRSGTMYGYEGIGCIYWHMVSKLLLAVQEQFHRAIDRDEDAAVQNRLAAHYHRIRQGLGFEKTAEQFGAFPTDPYSHTPRHSGAQQPGMTGQVKEEVLTRFGELGVAVRSGQVRFEPRLMQKSEFMAAEGHFEYLDVGGSTRTIQVPEQALAFTFCQVPVIYRLSERPSVKVASKQGETRVDGCALDAATSAAILGRTGEILELTVHLDQSKLIP